MKTIDELMDDFTTARNYVRDSYWESWKSYWDLYNNKRVKVSYKGIADHFDPMVFSTVETMVAAEFAAKPKTTYQPTNKEQEPDTKVLNALYDYYWDCNNMSAQAIAWGRDVKITGNGVLVLGWDGDKVTIDHYPIRDVLFDPTERRYDPFTSRYVIVRYLADKDDLETATAFDPKTGKQKKKYKDLDKIRQSGKPTEETDKEIKDHLEGSTVEGPAQERQVEVLRFYYQDGMYEVANRGVIIYQGENPYQREGRTVMMNQYVYDEGDGGRLVDTETNEFLREWKAVDVEPIRPFIPVVLQRCYTDGALIYGKGEVEPIADLQEQLNDLINQKSDNISFNINTMYAVDPASEAIIPKLRNIPGAVYKVKPEHIKPLEKPPLPPTADNEIIRIRQAIRETTGMDEIVKGVSQDKGDITATEVNAQMAQAGQRTALKLTQLENEGYKQLADIMFRLCQIFITDEMVIRVMGSEGVEWLAFNPEAYFGTYEPIVQLDATARMNKHEEVVKHQEMFVALQASPYINQQELTKLMLKKVYDLDDDEAKLLLQAPQMDMGALGGMGGAGNGQGNTGGLPGLLGQPGGALPQGAATNAL